MVITKLPRKPTLTANRSSKIDRFFKSKKRYKDSNGFFEGYFKICISGEGCFEEYGYSKEFSIDRDVEYRQAIEDAYFNALAKVYYRTGYMFTETDDLKNLDDVEVTESVLLDYNIYYPNFKDEKTLRITVKKKDGSTSQVVRFTKKGKFVKGGGLEISLDDEQATDDIFTLREKTFSRTREEAKKRDEKIRFSKRFK